MCGILGCFHQSEEEGIELRFNEGLAAIQHRGSDDHGIENFGVGEGNLFLGQTRLSIIDLTSGGHQPMFSHDKRYAVVFNGEIYNYQELREELKLIGFNFTTQTDTKCFWLLGKLGVLKELSVSLVCSPLPSTIRTSKF